MALSIVPALLALGATACAQERAVNVPPFQPRLERDDLGRWWSAQAVANAQVTWLARPWLRDLASGADQSWREQRPLLLWLAEGHPFACPDAEGVAARRLWEDFAVGQRLRSFVLAADDAAELRALGGATAAWWRGEGEGRSEPAAGVWLIAPDGAPLCSHRGADPAALAEALDAALAAWEARRGASPPPEPRERPGPLPRELRRADSVPLDGQVFEIAHQRLAALDAGPPETIEGDSSRDLLWFTAAEIAAALPPAGGLNPRGAWPEALARRLAHAVLADFGAGRIGGFLERDILRAELTLETKMRRRGITTVHLAGEFAAAHDGAWEQEPDGDAGGRWLARSAAARGARGRAVGEMDIEQATGRILGFRLLVLAQHWDASGAHAAAALVRNAMNWEEASRFVPATQEVDVPAADGLVPLRAVYADGVPELDGSLAEPAWSALPWSPDFGVPAARVRVLWHLDTLYLAAWTTAPELQVALNFPGAARQAVLTARADGSVAGVERARCFARTHGAGASAAHAFEIAIPWSALAGAAGAALPPQPGALAKIVWRSGDALLRAHAVFEPSRAVPGSFGTGSGLSR